MVKKIYMEGGGNSKSSKRAIRKHVSSFIHRAGVPEGSFQVIPSGSRSRTYKRFVDQHQKNEGTRALLLVDAEKPVTSRSPWRHLKNSDGWNIPVGVADEQCHLMVQVMESWFMADKEALVRYYGQKFTVKTLPKKLSIEHIPKKTVIAQLKRATCNTQKGMYNEHKKGKHGFEILARLNPEKVRQGSPYADRFFKTLLEQS